MIPIDGAAVGGSSPLWPFSSVIVVDGPAVGGSSSRLLSFSVTLVDGPAVGESSTPWLSISVNSSSVTRVDGPTVGCTSPMTAAAAKSSSVKMFASNGHSPHMLKPFTALEGVADRRNTFAKMPAMS